MFNKKTTCSIKQLEFIVNGLGIDPKDVVPQAYERPSDYGRVQYIEKFNIEIHPYIAHDISIEVSGIYVQYYGTGYRDESGDWHPTTPTKDKFKYEKHITTI